MLASIKITNKGFFLKKKKLVIKYNSYYNRYRYFSVILSTLFADNQMFVKNLSSSVNISLGDFGIQNVQFQL